MESVGDGDHERMPAEDEVHVWQAALDTDENRFAASLSLLAADERTRADRFVFDRDRRRYVHGRAILRILLGRYTGEDPAAVRIRYADHGKPFLADDAATGLRFNLSHAAGLAIYAFARNRRIGADLERVRDDLATDAIARRFFSAPEVIALERTPPEKRRRAFFACWTRKEAYVKAIGGGLSVPLGSFDVSVDPDAPAKLLRVAGAVDEPNDWVIETYTPARDFIAAIVVETGGREVRPTFHRHDPS